MKILLCDVLTRNTFTLQCRLGDRVEYLILKICEKIGILKSKLGQLQYQNKWLLKHELYLYDYNLTEGSIVYYRLNLNLANPKKDLNQIQLKNEQPKSSNKQQEKRQKERQKNLKAEAVQPKKEENKSEVVERSVLKRSRPIDEQEQKQLFFKKLKQGGIRDEVLQTLNKQQIYSMQELKACSQQMLISVGITLGQVLKLKKI